MAQHMSVLGIDIAKQVFHVVRMDDNGHVVLRKRLARNELLNFIANVPPVMRNYAVRRLRHAARRHGATRLPPLLQDLTLRV